MMTAMCALGMFWSTSAQAEWARQVLELEPGWNAVFLEVQPDANLCKEVFADVPVESVWFWNGSDEPARFVQDPTNLVPELPDWLTWFPAESPKNFLSDLFAVHGGRAYLIELGGNDPLNLELQGRLVVRKKKWVPDSLNLVGFHVNGEEPPTFRDFFSHDKATANQPVYRISTAGEAVLVADPTKETLEPGKAYWVLCDGNSNYDGPLGLTLEGTDGLAFGEVLTEQPLELVNKTAEPKQVTVRLLSSDLPTSKNADASLPTIAGDVALAFQRVLAWEPLNEDLTFTLDPSSRQRLNLAVIRGRMPGGAQNPSHYASILEVTDDEGVQYRIPVTAEKIINDAGLWVGTVTVDMVSEAGNPQNPDVPQPTGSPFKFRIMMHVDDQGVARLLREVALMQVQPVITQDPQTGEDVVSEPARYVLVTDDSQLSNFTGVSMRNGEIVGRRISTPVFGFDTPQVMTALTEADQDVLQVEVAMPYDHLLNPFLHQYHPDHDNLNERFEENSPLAEGSESYTFTRDIKLTFQEQDAEVLALPAYGYDVKGGIYTEQISGVHRRDITVQGTFILNRVSDVAILNDGN
jgi:hypothetical protein